MKKYLNETDKIVSIKLELRHPAGTNKVWVLVEGESDVRIFKKIINGGDVSVEQVHGGVESLRRAMMGLNEETSRVIGIRDADFLHLNNEKEDIENLMITDVHDMELMMIKSDVTLNNLIIEYLLPESTKATELRYDLLKALKFLGGIKWYNDIQNCKLNFKGLSLGNYFNPESMIYDEDRCVNDVNIRSKNRLMDVEKSNILELLLGVDDYYNLINGHDFIKALALTISHRVGGAAIKDSTIARLLRVSYTADEFRNTDLYDSLVCWNRENGYVLFKD